jgi:hypothetical protein
MDSTTEGREGVYWKFMWFLINCTMGAFIMIVKKAGLEVYFVSPVIIL